MNRNLKLIALLAAICTTALIFLAPDYLFANLSIYADRWFDGLPHDQQVTIARIGKVAGLVVPMVAAALIAMLGGIVVARRKKRDDASGEL
jgi:hypothetical protein